MPTDSGVPNIDALDSTPAPKEDRRREKAELGLLEAGEKFQTIVNRDKFQKFVLRWLAAIVGLVVIVGMAALLWHVMHQLKFWPFQIYSSSVLIAMFVAPIVSITTVTIALFVGAFRRFSDDDLDKVSVPNITNGASQIFGGN